jgi:hypothetical protein
LSTKGVQEALFGMISDPEFYSTITSGHCAFPLLEEYTLLRTSCRYGSQSVRSCADGTADESITRRIHSTSAILKAHEAARIHRPRRLEPWNASMLARLSVGGALVCYNPSFMPSSALSAGREPWSFYKSAALQGGRPRQSSAACQLACCTAVMHHGLRRSRHGRAR